MKRSLLFVLLTALMCYGLTAQTFSGGFKAGLNFSRFDGPSETGDTGQDLESYGTGTGFHIGATFALGLTDYFGLKADLMYSQKGTEYQYDGPSYFVLYNATSGTGRVLFGNRNFSLDLLQSYIDIPVMAYVRLGKLELSGGVNAAVLIGSRGTGGITFAENTGAVAPFSVTLDYGFFSSDYGVDAIIESENITLDNANFLLPRTIDAYYETDGQEGKKFNRLDFGLNAGAAFFLNTGLYVGFRYNYGLSDVTKTEQDFSMRALDADRNYVTREDKDRNISLQGSVGFRF
jgi:hypothetical protein